MIPDGYRILVKYDGEKEQFIASVPELGDLKAVGKTRAEALEGAEAEVENAFRQAAEEGKEMPPPLDGTEFSGELTVKVSPSLHRELVYLAKTDGIEIDQLLGEIVSAGCAIRSAIKSRPQATEHKGRDSRGRDGRRDGRRPGRGNRYFNIMDDKASFMEYVRGLETGGGGGRGGRRGGGGRGRGRK
jgi:predicted RNase H-like HicB family nuclease